ncbi:S-layer homology domain-containing protein [Microbacterium sp. A93]|uniref:S-layer homology domain-containing protein n=1 Tax=Microbacterium sp. A93 TaxID=3450716 RepID=UPI003F444E95
MSRPTSRRRTARWRLLATALTAGLLIPGAVVATPAYADSETLNPLDQSTQFDEDLPVLGDSLLEGLQRNAGEPAETEAAGSRSAAAALQHLGPCKQDFTDVAPKTTFYPHVTWMACSGLTKGYADHSFGVYREITRKEAAVMVYRMSGQSHDPGTARDFADVTPRSGDEGFTAISWMHEQEIVRGYVNEGQDYPSFKPAQSISRSELASYLFRFAGDTDYEAPTKQAFKDVPTTSAQYRDISWLAEHKMVSGYTDGTFRPGRKVARGETAKYLYGLETFLHGQPKPPATAPKPAPKPPAEVPLEYKYVVISDDGLNVRSGAGTQYSKVGSLARNTKVVWTGRSTAVSGVTWREITAGSLKGWVHGGYLMRDFEAGNAKSDVSRKGKRYLPDRPKRGLAILDADYAEQPNGYWCGPASMEISLSAFRLYFSQESLAVQAQTDREGTWLHQVARVMDYNAPRDVRYTVKTIPGSDANQTQTNTLRDDLREAIDAGVPSIVNIAATPAEQPPLQRAKTKGKFTLRHHMAIVGYNRNNDTFLVYDPWTAPFWLDTSQLADMAGTRGYTTLKR